MKRSHLMSQRTPASITRSRRLFRVAGVSLSLSLLLSLPACSAAIGEEQPLDSATEALTGQDSVMGFESAADWSASAGTIAATSVHSQGSTALSVNASYYTELTSAPLSTLSSVSSTLSLDFLPAQSPSWGQVQVLVDAPSRGVYSAYLGQVSVQGLPANVFSRLDFAVPAQVQQALSGSYSDLRFRISVNTSQGSGPVVLDNLRFAGQGNADCATGSAYTLTISGSNGIPADVVERIRCTFYTVYPELAAAYNPAAQTSVPLTFVEEAPGMAPAWETGGGLFINKGWITRHPLDADVIVHEGMHVVQIGYTGTVPGWIIEGTADFVRDKYGLTNAANGWSIPSGYAPGQSYLNGYGDAAAFFKWMDAKYRAGQPSVTLALDDILRAGTYSEAGTWPMLTGHTLGDLWLGYSGG